jgi:hypothetical protein
MDFCRLRFYSGHVWSQIARYMIVLACINRYILTTNNVRLQVITRPVVMRSIVASVVIFWHVASIHLLVLTLIKNERCGQFDVYGFVYIIYSVIFLCFIPSSLMIFFGYLAFHNLKRLHRHIQPIGHSTGDNGGNNTIHRRDQDLLLMVLVEGAVYVIVKFPYPIIFLENEGTSYMGINKSQLYLQIENLSTVGIALLYFNNAVPFYTYFATSRAFRKDVKELFTIWKPRLIERIIASLVPRRTQQQL